jgi:hypothetical protein
VSDRRCDLDRHQQADPDPEHALGDGKERERRSGGAKDGAA